MFVTAISTALGLNKVVTWIAIIGLILAIGGGTIMLIRADAVDDFRKDQLEDRIDDRTEAAKRRQEVENLDDDGLSDLLRGLFTD